MSGYNVDAINQLSWREAEDFEGNLPSTRGEAKAVGAKWYRTGKACKRGHETVRLVSSKNCARCKLEENGKRYGRKIRERERPGFVAAETAMDRAKANDALPGVYRWKDLLEATLPLYARAKQLTEETGRPYEVDHIVPLAAGREAGGIHQPSNLRVILKIENLKKASKEIDCVLLDFARRQDRDLSMLNVEAQWRVLDEVEAAAIEYGFPFRLPGRCGVDIKLDRTSRSALERVMDRYLLDAGEEPPSLDSVTSSWAA